MPTITTDKPGFTTGALDFATDMLQVNTTEEMCRALVGAPYDPEFDLPTEAIERGLTLDEFKVAVRSALAAKLMREGVLNIQTGG